MITLGKVFGELSKEDVFVFNLWRTLVKWHAGPITGETDNDVSLHFSSDD